MNLQKSIALKISKLLLEHDLSRYAFCNKIGMSEQSLKHIIDERNKDIKLSTLYQIIDGFDLTLEEFFADDIFDKNKLL